MTIYMAVRQAEEATERPPPDGANGTRPSCFWAAALSKPSGRSEELRSTRAVAP